MRTTTLEQPPIRRYDAWGHQLEAYHFAIDKTACMLAMDMGTGKSKVAIDDVVNKDARRILILCPTSVRSVWRREFDRHAPGWGEVVVLDKGTVAKRTELARQAIKQDRPVVVVINYEAAHGKVFAEFALSTAWCCTILDESHRVKSPTTKVSKFADKLRRASKQRLCLTGTPMPATPLDVFGQYRFLDPNVFGHSWHRFRHTYGKFQNPTIPQMLTGFQRLDELQNKFGSLAYRVDSSVLDLPEAQHDVRAFDLSRSAAKLYRDMEQDFIAELDGGVVTASNALVKTLRLRQLVSGFLTEDDTKRIVSVDDGKEKLLLDLLQDIDNHEPVVVFAEFQHDLATINRVGKKLGRRCGELSGHRKDITEHAEVPTDIDLLAVQYQSGGVGIDLTRARYAIYYSPTYSLGNYEQSLARVNRPGQTRPVVYYHLVASGTIDELVYKALEQKANVIDFVMGIFRKDRAA